MRNYVVTGSASGLGAKVREFLEAEGIELLVLI